MVYAGRDVRRLEGRLAVRRNKSYRFRTFLNGRLDDGYAKNGGLEWAIGMFNVMIQNGINPGADTELLVLGNWRLVRLLGMRARGWRG